MPEAKDSQKEGRLSDRQKDCNDVTHRNQVGAENARNQALYEAEKGNKKSTQRERKNET